MNTQTAVIDAPGATPELLPHEWADNGECTNPEIVTIDFGAKRGQREASILLGLRPDGTWRCGWAIATKDGTRHTEPCRSAGSEWPNRSAALRIALGNAQKIFDGDSTGVRGCAGMFAKTMVPSQTFECPTDAPDTRLASNTSDSRPLPTPRFAELALKSIERNPEQPRKDFPAAALKELADSIASTGLLEPIVVRKLLPDELAQLPGIDDVERFEIMAGERRHRAFVLLDRETIPCMIYEGLTRAQAAAPALIENVQREGLNAVEEALAYRDLMAREGLTQEQCAQRVGKSRPVIANALRMLDLPENVIALIREGKLTAAHGTALARFKVWPKVAEAIAEIAAKEKATTADLEGGLPFADELVKAGLAVKVESSKFNYKIPPALKKNPSYFDDEVYGYVGYMLDIPAYGAALEKARAEQKADREAQQKKEAKKAPTQKTFDDVKDKVHKLNDDQVDLALELLPDKSVSDVKASSWSSEKVTVCTHQVLAKKIDEALAELRGKDRLAKIPPLVEKARAALGKIKKLGAREFALLLWLSQQECGPGVSDAIAKRVGVKLPKLSRDVSYRLLIEDLEALATADVVGVFRVLAESKLDNDIEQDTRGRSPSERAACITSDGDAAVLIKWFLEIEDLGLLEDSKEGQKQLVAAVEAQDWYQRELAKAEGRDPLLKNGSNEEAAAARKPSQAIKAKKVGCRAVITDETRFLVKRAVAAGKTGTEIAKEVGISLPSVQNIKKALGLIRR